MRKSVCSIAVAVAALGSASSQPGMPDQDIASPTTQNDILEQATLPAAPEDIQPQELAGLLIPARLRLVTNIPRTAYA